MAEDIIDKKLREAQLQDNIENSKTKGTIGLYGSDSHRSLNGLNTNYATSNKWIGYVPIQDILGSKYRNLELNLTKFTIPQVQMGSATASYKGYSIEVPTKVINAGSREITFEYIVDADWFNYKALCAWSSAIGIISPMTESTVPVEKQNQTLIDCRVWLLDPFKRRIIDFKFENCWVKQFGDLQLDYTNADEIKHSFTMSYTNYTIVDDET